MSLQRLDPNRVHIPTPAGVDITLYANEDVFIDGQSVDEIVRFSAVADTIKTLREHGFLGSDARLDRIVLTPDFHKGAGIPIGTVLDAYGFVIPKAVGSDIGCGMRLLATDVTQEEFTSLGEALDRKLRYIFFEGGRNIPLSARQRNAIFRNGLQGLLDERHADEGIWKFWRQDQQVADVMRSHLLGSLPTEGIFNLDDFMRGSGAEFSRDDQIGSIGGSNHFVEVQRVEEVFDGYTANSWGLKQNTITIMAHTGSVSIGHMIGKHFMDVAKKWFPKTLKHEHDFYLLPGDSEPAKAYISAMNNAANFAFANRMFLGLMVVRALSECLGREIDARLVYDAPHNLIWSNGDHHIHRKGACPAGGPSTDPEFPYGHPVIIPGSMGSSSFILRGNGLDDCLCSACHGAGRMAPRQSARRADVEEFNELRVVTKIDPRMCRRDIADEYRKSLLEEAPSMYKPTLPAIDTLVNAGIANKVARVWPLMTIKGL